MAFKIVVSICLMISLASSSINSNIPQSRIINGNTDSGSQFPWHASLEVSYSNPSILYCGGSIISENFILTSADCVNEAKSIKIGVGSSTRTQPAKSLVSNTYYIHPAFNRSYYQNNIGLVKLPTALVWTQTLTPIRLISRSQSGQTFTGVETYFTGFGRTDENVNAMADRLKWVRQRAISNQECALHYHPLMILAAQVCSIGLENPFEAACFGDEGGALVINEWGTWTQIGVLSFVTCQYSRPTAFVRISEYMDWISKTAAYNFRA